MIHFRLGSLYHSNIWSSSCSEGNRKHIIQLAKTNYEKASKLYMASSDIVHFLTSQMQRFALNEFLAESKYIYNFYILPIIIFLLFFFKATVSPVLKLKHLQTCLSIIIELIPMLKKLSKKKLEVPEDDVKEFIKLINEKSEISSFKNCSSLLILVKQRLQYTLRLLIKLCMNKPPINKESTKLSKIYKNCYSSTFTLENQSEFYLFLDKLLEALCRIEDAIKDYHNT